MFFFLFIEKREYLSYQTGPVLTGVNSNDNSALDPNFSILRIFNIGPKIPFNAILYSSGSALVRYAGA